MGRGSSKIGGGGRGRGGGLSTSDILSTRDMIAQRGLTQKQVDEVLDVAKDLFNKYGEDSIPEELQIATLSKRKRNQVLAGSERKDDHSLLLRGLSGRSPRIQTCQENEKWRRREEINSTFKGFPSQ